MLPQHPPILVGKDAKRFIDQDKRPLTSEEKDDLRRCLEIYKKNPIKWDA